MPVTLPDDEAAARVAAVIERYQLGDPEARVAVEDTYRSVAAYSGPALTVITDDLLAGVREQAARRPEQVVVFVGRDGFPLAAAAQGLDPEFVAQRTRTVALSRVVLEHALRDLETNTGRDLGLPPAFRLGSAPDPARAGSYRQLTRYLAANGVPVGREGSAVAVVDTSYKGTSQEMLAVAYPATEFTGHYAFFGAHPEDSHPGSKSGYALHRDPDPGGGFPVAGTDLAGAALWAHPEAIAAIEDLHHGALAKPREWTGSGPEQRGMRADDAELADLNPARLAPGFTDPVAREAGHDAALLAVGDVARHAGRRARGGDPAWRANLDAAATEFSDQLRTWITHRDPSDRPGLDPRLGRVLDAFAHRLDRDAVHRVDAALADRGINRDDPQVQRLWQELAAAEPAEREHIVVAAREQLPAGAAGEVSRDQPASPDRGVESARQPGREGAQVERVRTSDPQAHSPQPEIGQPAPGRPDPPPPEPGRGQLRGDVERARAAREDIERGGRPRAETEGEAHRRRAHHDTERTRAGRDRGDERRP